MDIEGKVAFITGTRRIGRLVGLALGQRGARGRPGVSPVPGLGRPGGPGASGAGRQAMPVQADLSRAEEIEDAVKRIAAVWGGVDILVNLASVYASKPFEETTGSDWDLNMNVNLRSAFLCARAVTPGMKANGGGRIINCADWTAASGRPRYRGYLPYYVSKVGVVGLTEALALELAPYNILVNAIAPGPMVPPPDLTPEAVEKVRQVTPLGRWGGGGTDRPGGGRPDRERFHHGRMHPGRWRPPYLVRVGSPLGRRLPGHRRNRHGEGMGMEGYRCGAGWLGRGDPDNRVKSIAADCPGGRWCWRLQSPAGVYWLRRERLPPIPPRRRPRPQAGQGPLSRPEWMVGPAPCPLRWENAWPIAYPGGDPGGRHGGVAGDLRRLQGLGDYRLALDAGSTLAMASVYRLQFQCSSLFDPHRESAREYRRSFKENGRDRAG